MMDEQLAQNQTIEALRRQVETSNITALDATTDWDWWCHQQYSLCAILVNSIEGDAHKRAAWTGLLPCGITGGPRICRAEACHVWS